MENASAGRLHRSGRDIVASRAAKIDLRLAPNLLRHLLAHLAAVAVAGPEMDAAIDARLAAAVGRFAERCPCEAHVLRRPAIELEAVGRDNGLVAEGVAAGRQLEQRRGGGAERTVAGHVLGRRRGRQIGPELLALDGLRAAARAAPGLDGLAAEVMLDERLRARSVPANLGIDRGNAGIEHRVAEREEQFYVVVELVAALLGGKLRELRPEAGWLLGSRFQCPVLGSRLLHVAELGAEADDLFAKLLRLGVRAGHGRRDRGTEFPRHVERERPHLGEMRRAEIAHLQLALRVDRRWRLEAARL